MIIFVVACVVFVAGIIAALVRYKQDEDMKMPVGLPLGIVACSLVLAATQCI